MSWHIEDFYAGDRKLQIVVVEIPQNWEYRIRICENITPLKLDFGDGRMVSPEYIVTHEDQMDLKIVHGVSALRRMIDTAKSDARSCLA